MRTRRIAGLLALIVTAIFAANASAQTYSVVIGDLQGIESLEQLVETMGVDMGVTLNMKRVPMPRLTATVQEKQADFGTPMLYLKDPAVIKNLPFDYSTAVINKMCFILYTNKGKPIDVANLRKGNSKKYKIESDIANAQMFGFATLPSTNIVGSLKKVNDGLIDGYIMGTSPADDIIKAAKGEYANVKRQLWDIYDTGFAIPKGARGGPVDKFLVAGMAKMVSSGKLTAIMGDATVLVGTYVDWQP